MITAKVVPRLVLKKRLNRKADDEEPVPKQKEGEKERRTGKEKTKERRDVGVHEKVGKVDTVKMLSTYGGYVSEAGTCPIMMA